MLDIAGNPLIQVVDNSQTVDTVNPSTFVPPAVSDIVVSDEDDTTTLTVTFTFDEAMDQAIDPVVTFEPAVAATLTGQTGRWTDAQTYVVEAVVADADIDADEVTIDITGAHDVAGNLQADHEATVGLEIDTVNPSTVGAPMVSVDLVTADLITDADDGSTLTVSFSFNEVMDVDVLPTVTFDPDVASTLTGQTGSWTDPQTYVVEAVVADAGVDVDAVTVDITARVILWAIFSRIIQLKWVWKSTLRIRLHRRLRLKLLTVIRRMVMRRRRSLFRRAILIQACCM